ncbi:MAG: cyclic nucleotide-binding domain-containing protein [Burkholderiaceae bacterium]
MSRNDALLQTIAANVHLFRGMNRTQLVTLLSVAEKCSVHAGHYCFDEGDVGSSFYVLIGGTVVVQTQRDGHRVELAQLRARDCFGEMCLVGVKTRSATVRALQDTLALRFSRDKVDAQHELAALIYRNIASVAVRRLMVSNDKLGELMVRHDDGPADRHLYGIRPVQRPPDDAAR